MIYEIKYALGGGFGGIKNKDWEEIEAESLKEANEKAYGRACEEYESYVGGNGLRSVAEIIEQDGVDEEEAEIMFNEERDSWLDYCAREKK
jgi:hypothetical protein